MSFATAQGGACAMSKETTSSTPALWAEMLHTALYKPMQGKMARQATGFGLALAVCIGAWRLLQVGGLSENLAFPVSIGVAVLGCWFCYRVVNWPPFADFLIGVEAEMKKVSWPGWLELKRSSIVVIMLIVGLTSVLFAFDLIWYGLLKYVLGVIV